MAREWLRSQAAMQYLYTYGMAILIIVAVLATLYALGVLSPSNFVGSSCIMQAGFSCTILNFATNGTFTFKIVQNTQSPITILGVGCNASEPAAITVSGLSINAPIAGNATLQSPCYSNGAIASGVLGKSFKGYVDIEYVNQQSAFTHVATGSVVLVATATTITTTSSTSTT
jgi:hypothetical protein